MTEKKIIRFPTILDDPVVGRHLAPFPIASRLIQPPLNVFTDQIVVDGDRLTLERSKTSIQKEISFDLHKIAKFLIKMKHTSCWSKDHRLKPFAALGREIELYLVDTDGGLHLLVPKFLIDASERGKSDWVRFLSELREASGLPLEEEPITSF